MQQSITDRVKTYEDACQIKGIAPLTPEQFAFLPEDQREALFALHKLFTVVEVINEGHEFDWNDYNEYKYYPWFDMETYDDAPAGSGFSFDVYVFDCASSSVGARLCVRSQEHAEYIGKQFLSEYKAWMKK